jgi:alpha-mannosidase
MNFFFKIKGSGLTLLFILMLSVKIFSQNAYFIDGYHGGIYGHYPNLYTQFIVDMFNKNPEWKINLEIEPETWDSVKVKNPEAYLAFKALFNNKETYDRIEFTNPTYAQGYLYNIPGESIIKQFTFGMQRILKHFPNVTFTTYSVEEPCFTSSLPQILKSLGFKYAVMRCPNTCWGGYPRAFGGELINWVGPDGTKIVAVPRYACEGLVENSNWQTTSCNNSVEFINTCFANGIKNPVGMTYQDAGWRGGPWKTGYKPSIYETWRNYFENVSIKTPQQDWKFSQEDIQVSLVWGAQVLQKLAQRVRVSENKIITAEKLASIAAIFQGAEWPKSTFDEAWRTLLLSQHHDCWIVPYNGRPGYTWADNVAKWTGATNQKSDSIIQQSLIKLSGGNENKNQYIRVFNTSGSRRNEYVKVRIPDAWGNDEVKVLDSKNQKILSQVIKASDSNGKVLIFTADVPSMGYTTYQLQKEIPANKKGMSVSVQADGTYKIESDLYQIILDPSKGGTINSLIAKKLQGKEFVDHANAMSFNELRGNFFKDGGFYSSKQNPATIRIIENGPLMVRLEVKGMIATHPFTQVISVMQGQKRIDLGVKIDWKGNPGIGDEYAQNVKWQQAGSRKAFYNNQDKLLTLFPLNFKDQKVYVNAPFDVTESKLSNTFFTRWDSIKNDIVQNWVDITDANNRYGMALLTDHTTSYAHGTDFPLGLTMQYSGIGLWGRNYSITGPTEINYSLIPHAEKWDKSKIWSETSNWNEPLLATIMNSTPASDDLNRSLLDVTGTGLEVSSVTVEGKDLLVRLFNAEGDDSPKTLTYNMNVNKVEIVTLNGKKVGDVKTGKDKKNQSTINVSMPRFGIRTLKFIH